MGGGGKGGGSPGPIYRPEFTNPLERLLTAQAVGTAASSNPQLVNVLTNSESGRRMLSELGVSSPQGGSGGQRGSGDKSSNDSRSAANQLASFGANAPSVNYSGMANQLASGRMLNGQAIPQWQPGQAFQYQNSGQNFQFQQPNYRPQQLQPAQQYREYQFRTPNLNPVNTQAYQQALNSTNDNIQQQARTQSDQVNKSFGARGLGRSGLNLAAQGAVAREALNQSAQAASNIGLEQARSSVDLGKTMASNDLQKQQAQASQRQYGAGLNEQQRQFGATFGEGQRQYGAGLQQWRQQQQASENLQRSNLGLQTQQAQADENMRRSQLGLQGQQTLQGLQLQQIGAMGTLQNQAAQEAMRPYQMLSSLYGQNIGIPVPSGGGGGKGDPLSAFLNAGAQVGGAAIMAPALACLPQNTLIELEDGTRVNVQDVRVGDMVRGGKVISTSCYQRAPGHRFSLHTFKDGREVTMTFGHPIAEGELESVREVDHSSPVTHDILTSEGFYYVNGVKLRSTIQGAPHACN